MDTYENNVSHNKRTLSIYLCLECLQLSLTIKLVLDNVVESLEKEKNQVMVLSCREQEPGGGKGLQQVEQFISCYH